MNITALSSELIHRANYNSFNGKRGDLSNQSYQSYAQTIQSWPISDEKKQKLLDKLHQKYSEILRHEAQHVSVMVAGPAKYNAKRLDHSDQILRLSAEFCDWFKELERQVKDGQINNDKESRLLEMIEFTDSRPELDPTNRLIELSVINNTKFIALFEKLLPKYKWRKNSTIYKLYARSIAGEIKEVKKDVFFEDENLTAYREGDRAYIKFAMKPARQLIVALKSRGWFWNAYKNAWSTYLNKVDESWVSGISTQYSKYI